MNIEIFKSESYQNILKHVIKFKYPELSLEDGLQKEGEYDICSVMTKYFCSTLGYEVEEMDIATNIFWFNSEIAGSANQVSYTILGRPISICELCDVLNDNLSIQKTITRFAYMDWKLQTVYGSFNMIILQSKAYSLHEQSQEIIDKIADLFD